MSNSEIIQEQATINARRPWNTPEPLRKEVVDAQALAWCYLNFDKLSEAGLIKKMRIGTSIVTNEVYKQELKKYLESFNLKNYPLGEKDVAYEQGALREGRFMARTPLSLQTISRQIRHTISRVHLRDIDAVAAHPSILYHILRPIYNFEFEALGQYLSNDEAKNKIVEDILQDNPTFIKKEQDENKNWVEKEVENDKEKVKQSICSVLNGGGYSYYKKPTQWYCDYFNQAQVVLSKIVKQLDETIPAYRVDSEMKKGKNYHAINGSIVNHLLVDYENRIAYYMRFVLESKKFKVVALTHDGCMVREDEKLDTQVLRDIEKVFEDNNLKGIKLKYKAMDEGFTIPEKELSVIDIDHIVFEKTIDYDNFGIIKKTLGEGDSGLSKLFHHKVKDIIKTVSMDAFDGYRWNPRTRLWDKQTKEFFTNYITEVLEPIAKPYLNIAKKALDECEEKEALNKLKEEVKTWTAVVKYIQSSKGCKAVWDKARTLLYDKTFVDTLNNVSNEYPMRDGFKVNLTNGKVSLRTKADFWDFESPATYIEGETEDKTRIFKYLKSVCCEADAEGKDIVSDEDAVFTKWLFKLFGYCLTREVADRKLYICHGKGCNSKSVIMDMISNIMVQDKGYSPLNKKAIIKRDDKKSGANPELMPFQYCRMGAVIETDEKEKLDAPTIKSLTGNDAMRVRDLYKSEITIKPKAKIFLISNHKPEFDSEDQAMRDRIVFIPFSQRFVKNPVNTKKVEDMVANDKDHFFSLMVDYGIQWWADKDLTLPNVCQEATTQFVEDNSDIDPWIQEEFIFNPTKEQVEAQEKHYNTKEKGLYSSKAYDNYYAWCAENEKPSRSVVEWKKALEQRDFTIKKSNGVPIIKKDKKHIVLRASQPQEEQEKEDF